MTESSFPKVVLEYRGTTVYHVYDQLSNVHPKLFCTDKSDCYEVTHGASQFDLTQELRTFICLENRVVDLYEPRDVERALIRVVDGWHKYGRKPLDMDSIREMEQRMGLVVWEEVENPPLTLLDLFSQYARTLGLVVSFDCDGDDGETFFTLPDGREYVLRSRDIR